MKEKTPYNPHGGNPMTDQRLTYTISEVARLLNLSRSLTYQAAHRGELPVIKVGKRLLIPKAALEKMLAEAGKPRLP